MGLVLLTAASAFAEEPGDLLWAKGVSGGSRHPEIDRGVAAFSDGSSIIVGSGAGVFGPGEPNETTLTPAPFSGGLFVARYGASGALAWARLIHITLATGGAPTGNALSVATFPDGSSVVTGVFGNRNWGPQTATFGLGEPNQTSFATAPGDVDMFVARYNADGSLAWARKAGGLGDDTANSVAAFADGSSIVTGYIKATSSGSQQKVFGEGEPNPTTLVAVRGMVHAFVARYNANGTLAWARLASSGDRVFAYSVAAVADGSAVITGTFDRAPTFGAGEANETTLPLLPTGFDFFVARYNPNGTLAWVRRAGGGNVPGFGEGADEGRGVAAFADGSAVVTGVFRGSAVFGSGEPNQTTLVSIGGSDMFLARYNANGTLAWVRGAGSSWTGTESGIGHVVEQGFGVATLPDGSSVVTGRFFQSAVFGAEGANPTTLDEQGAGDVFVAVYDANGSLAWARRAGGPFLDDGRGVAASPDGSFVITGVHEGTAVFGAGEPNQTTVAGSTGRFLARYAGGAAPGIAAPASIVQECDDTHEVATVNFVFDVTPGPADLLRVLDTTGARTLLEVSAPADQTYGVGPVEFPQGTSTILVELLDGATVVASASFAVQIEDTVAPVISGAVSQTLELQGPLTTLYRSTLGISVVDACDPVPTLEFAPGAVGIGTTTVTATARDATGNATQCTFDVTVVDTTDPVFTVVPADVERHCEASETLVGFDVLAEDLSGSVTVVCVDQAGRPVEPSGTPFGVGVHTVTCTATDSSGNDATWAFRVTIVDDEAPVIVVPQDITVGTAPGVSYAFVEFTVVATDECDPDAGLVCTAPWGAVQAGGALPVGATAGTSTATDHSGNAATSAFNITVQDREPPVLSGPSSATLVTDCCGSLLTVSPEALGVTATDNADPEVSIVWTPASVAPGTTEVVFTATDDDGNQSQQSVQVTVLRGAFELRFLQPLDMNVDNKINPGRTVPVKVRVSCDNVFDAGVMAVIDRVERIDGSGTPIANEVIEDAGSSNDNGVTMRLADSFYIFNLSTADWATASGARFRVTVRISKSGHTDTLGSVILKNR